MDIDRSADERAALLTAELTLDEMISMVHGPIPAMLASQPADGAMGVGYIPGVARLGVPALNETDASLGVANPRDIRPGDGATGLPSGLALASSFDPELAYAAGAMVGSEARDKGFNVLLGGGANLTREPRCGRNFEYLGEDPLLAGVLAGEAIRGAQSNHIVCTLKHFALNDQETCRHVVDARIDEGALRESDLLAFQIAIERGDPGSVMCAYNRVNGEWAGENDVLLNQVLKRDWGYKGWVMSDWGAVHSTAKAALAGLDQQSGEQLDKAVYFGAALKAAVEAGEVPFERLADMVRRILRSLFHTGVFDHPPERRTTDYAANGRVSRAAAEAGIVLLKNDGLLPLPRTLRRIAVIGAHADIGVLSGGGSSQVIPVGGPALTRRVEFGMSAAFAQVTYQPSSPLAAIRALMSDGEAAFDAGTDPHAAAELARACDVAIIFAEQWATEGQDLSTLSLPEGQDALISAVAAANPRTVVVLETGGPVLTPWLDEVSALIEAWYPGTQGGQAIANVLFGVAAPSGRLPISFPRSVDDLVRPDIPGMIFGPPVEGRTLPTSEPGVQQHKGRFSVEHPEGADVGYRWYARTGRPTRFPFGFGLTYTRFVHSGLATTGGETVTAHFDVTNAGARAGVDTPQLYVVVADAAGRPSVRLAGWARVRLEPGETRRVEIAAEPRLLAVYDTGRAAWRIDAQTAPVRIASSAETATLTGEAVLTSRSWGP